MSQGYLLSDDLIFTSRIVGTGRALGIALETVKSMSALLERAGNACPGGVIIDLSNPGLVIEELIAGLREKCASMPRVVAYGSHVEVETLKRARAAGCDLVLPRSKFVEELPTRLMEWVSARERGRVSAPSAEARNVNKTISSPGD